MAKKNILISVIIPCKNEEKNIERCLNSVVSELRDLDQSEVLVIDSRSTDKSMEKAKQFPVDIIQLGDKWFTAPASGRYLGCINTSGKYILVIDADMELLPGFLAKAIDFLDKDEQAAGVAGIGTEYYEDGSSREDMYQRGDKIADVYLLAGAAIFKRQALLVSGYFNPFLRAEEEHELCLRLIKAGFKLFSLPYPMIKHYTSLKNDNFKRRLKAGMYRGIGQMFRLTLKQKNFSFIYLVRFKLFYLFTVFIMGSCWAIFNGLNNSNSLIFFIWLGIIICMWLFSCYIKRGFKKGTYSLYKWVLINTHIFLGILEATSEINEYPKDVIIIKKRTDD